MTNEVDEAVKAVDGGVGVETPVPAARKPKAKPKAPAKKAAKKPAAKKAKAPAKKAVKAK